MESELEDALDVTNYIFIAVFTLEAIIKVSHPIRACTGSFLPSFLSSLIRYDEASSSCCWPLFLFVA